MNNPLLDFSGLPRFDAIAPEHVAPAIDQLLAEAEAAVARRAGRAGHLGQLRGAAGRCDRAPVASLGPGRSLARRWSIPRSCARRTTPTCSRSRALAARWGKTSHRMAQYKKLAATPESKPLTTRPRRKVIDNALRDFRLGGAELDDAGKQRFSAIQEAPLALSAKFLGRTCSMPTDAWSRGTEDPARLAGLPAEVLAAASRRSRQGRARRLEADPADALLPAGAGLCRRSRVACHPVSMRNSERASEFRRRCVGQQRQHRAHPRPARRVGGTAWLCQLCRGIRSPPRWRRARSKCWISCATCATRARPHAQRDRAELEAFARDELGLAHLEAWDLAYASEKLKQARCSFEVSRKKRFTSVPSRRCWPGYSN